MIEKTSWEPNQNSRFSVGDFRGPPIVFSLYKRAAWNEISKMPKVKNKNKARKSNRQQGGRPKSKTSSDEIPDPDDDSDEDYFSGAQPRRVDNSPSMLFMNMMRLQMILDAASNCVCGSPQYKSDVSSYQGFNCNVLLRCKCGNTKRMWGAPENFDQASLAACKLSGIKTGQIQEYLICLNFGYTNNEGKSYTVNMWKPRISKMSQDLDIKFDGMKKIDEQNNLNQLLSSNDTKEVEISTDGMYPIRNNSGICVSTVMGTVGGVKKIICKSKNTVFFKIPYFLLNIFSFFCTQTIARNRRGQFPIKIRPIL